MTTEISDLNVIQDEDALRKMVRKFLHKFSNLIK